LSELWHQATADKKLCYFPVLNNDQTLCFLPATPNTKFKKNKLNIPEPDINKDTAIPVAQLNLMVLPLVAFDIRCTRLGMGAGFYDRTLEDSTRAKLIGVGYQFQRVDIITPNHWDIPLDGVITQRAIYWRLG
jgi:5-formyltetrahydrofolate cyclo-ligase